MNASEKEHLRQSTKQHLTGMSPQERDGQNRRIVAQLLKRLPPESGGICAYMPLPDEAEIRPVLEEILARGIPLFLPRFDNQTVTFHSVTSLEGLRPGTSMILEPAKDNPEPDPTTITLALVPGRAFDRHGNRLGRGKAGYDRWIRNQRQANPGTRFFGIAFTEQIVDQVPVEAHDEKMDTVITPEGPIATA